jgi:predicted porin
MGLLKHLLLASTAGLLFAGAAQAADLPTKKTPPAPPQTSCFASFYDWLNSSAADCPLSYMGVTVYGQIDTGGGYETHASPFNRDYNNGVLELVSKNSNTGRWQAVPNGLSQSNVGLKIKEQIVPNWFLVGDANFGFDPYSLQPANGPKSLVDNNFYSSKQQNLVSTNADSSRAGQWDNARAYIGVNNTTFGTLTFGRQYSLTNDLASAYDPFGGAYAFSLIGTSGSVEQGTGETETARYNESFKYQVAYNGFRAATIVQVGGWEQGNGAQGAYQFDLGADYAGFSIDGIYAHDKDAVKLGAYGGVPPAPDALDTLKATLADVNAGVFGAKYKWQALTLYGGYEYARLSTPSDLGVGGIPTGAIYTLNGGYPGVIQANAFAKPEDLQVLWVGAKYAILSNLDGAVGFYHEWQNDYDTSPATNCLAFSSQTGGKNIVTTTGQIGQGTFKGDCAGTTNAVSGMLDWRPFKRVDVYGGVMYTKVAGGMASGYINDNNTAFTAGVRVGF